MSVAPDGRTLVYLSYVASTGTGDVDLVAVDVQSGRSRNLASPTGLGIRKFEIGSPDGPVSETLSWSPDGRQVTYLHRRDDGAFVLTTWDVRGSGRARQTVIDAPEAGEGEIVGWTWVAGRDELLFGIQADVRPDYRGLDPVDGSYAWYWSIAVANFQSVQNRQQGGGRLRLFRAAIGARRVTEIPMPGAFRVDPKVERRSWHFSPERNSILFGTRDPVLGRTDLEAEFAAWLIASHDPRARAYAGAHNRVFEWRLDSNSVQEVRETGPRMIGAIGAGRHSEPLMMLEDLAHSYWPADERWATVQAVGACAGCRLPGELYLSTAQIFSGPTRRSVYIYEGGARNRLLGVDLVSGVSREFGQPGFAITGVSVSEDGQVVAAIVQNVATPPNIYVMHRGSGRWRRLTDVRPNLPFPASRVEWVTWRSSDDRLDLDGFVVYPPRFDPGRRYPMIVQMGGGLIGMKVAYENEYNPWFGDGGIPANVLAASDYLVFIPNHRGVADRSPDYAPAHIGHAGDYFRYDVEAGIDALIARGFVDPDQLAITGHSGGSEIAFHAIAHSRRFKAALIEDGPFMMPEILAARTNVGAAWWYWSNHEVVQRVLGYDPFERRFSDPYAVSTPLLMRFQSRLLDRPASANQPLREFGWEDSNVRTQLEMITTSLWSRGVPVELILDRDGHSVRDPAYLPTYANRVIQWFDYFVRGRGTRPSLAPRDVR